MELLLAHVLQCERMDLYVEFERPMAEDELARIRALLRRRADGEPVAYLVGRREFYSLAFDVDARVLVPRPETEHLVDVALKHLHDEHGAYRLIDVGTGSGCVAISVLHHRHEARALASDVSGDALAVASANADRHGVSSRLTLAAGDLLEPAHALGADDPGWRGVDAVLANLPYVAAGDPSVEVGVSNHEPTNAVFVDGEDPLLLVRRLIADAASFLTPGGLLAVEVGAGSASDAAKALAAAGYHQVHITDDLARIGRIVSAHAPPQTG